MSTETQTNDELTAVQERLFEMLNSVSLDEQSERKAPTKRAAATVAPPSEVPAVAPPEKKTSARSHPTDCSNCGASEALASSSWCESCGFHPRLNRCLEVEAPVDGDENRELTMLDLVTRVPVWMWILGAGMTSVILLGGFIRAGLPDIEERSPLALMMIFCGLLTFAICHVRAFYIGLQNSEKFNFGTLIAHPIETWRPALQQLPNTRRLVYGMAWGLTAVAMALFIVGVDWNGLFKPSTKKRSTFNPLALIMKAAVTMSSVTAGGGAGGGEEGSSAMGDMMDIIGEAAPEDGSGAGDNVEDALDGFAGKAMGSSIDKEQEKKDDSKAPFGDILGKVGGSKDAADKFDEEGKFNPAHGEFDATDDSLSEDTAQDDAVEMPGNLESRTGAAQAGADSRGASRTVVKEDDFLIFGYTLSVTGQMHSVVIAELSNARSGRYVATVPVDQLPDDIVEQLQEQLDQIRTSSPALRAPLRARWVAPTYTCTVSYKGRSSVGTLKNPKLISYRQMDHLPIR